MGDNEQNIEPLTPEPPPPALPENPGANLPERDPQTLERGRGHGDLEKRDY